MRNYIRIYLETTPLLYALQDLGATPVRAGYLADAYCDQMASRLQTTLQGITAKDLNRGLAKVRVDIYIGHNPGSLPYTVGYDFELHPQVDAQVRDFAGDILRPETIEAWYKKVEGDI